MELELKKLFQYDPVLTPGNEKIVHHIVLYRCRGEEPKYAHKDYDCYGLTKEYRPECRSVFLMYEIGAGVSQLSFFKSETNLQVFKLYFIR